MPAADSLTEAIDPTAMRAQTRVGTTLRGKWHLDVLLGVGGMAAVYAASHRNGTRAAIKILHPELGLHADVRARFFREGRVANTVNHDGAVKVVDEDEDGGSIYLVMELLDGESLDARAARSDGKLPVDEVLAAADQLLDVLIAAHERGVIHRDLKPENVFLTRDGVVKVLDFGIARLRELSTQSHATRAGASMGTPSFMAPEQARGLWDEVDARADLWAVGATMFALITGKPVHEGRTANEVLVAAVTQKAAPIATLVPDIPQPVAALIDRALAFEKSERWPDAKTMQDALRRAYHATHGSPISTHPRLFVPASVPNRTLASAGVEPPPSPRTARTSAAVVAGQSGVPLTAMAAQLPQSVLLVGGAIGAGVFFAVIVVVGSLVASSRHGSSQNSTAAAAPASEVVPAIAPPIEQPTKPDASITKHVDEPQVVSVEELPAVTPKKPVPVPPPKPAPYTPPTSWKDQRK